MTDTDRDLLPEGLEDRLPASAAAAALADFPGVGRRFEGLRDAFDQFDRFAAHSPENAQAIAAANPMGRMGDPETDIGPVAVFLASDDCRYVTGNTLFVDGGGHINGVAWAPQLPD